MKRSSVFSQARIFIFYSVISGLLLLGDSRGWLRFVHGGAERVIIPLQRATNSLSLVIGTPFQVVRFWYRGSQRIEDLERQVAKLSVDAAKVFELENENEAMRLLLGASLPSKWRYIPAAVVGVGEQFSIGVGEVEGIVVGDAVVWEDVLVGIVSEVSAHQSKVKRLDDADTLISVYVASSGTRGVVVGEFGSRVLLKEVLQDEQLQAEDILVTSGEIGAPRGFAVGKVVSVESKESDVYKLAVVETLVDSNKLREAFVVKPEN